MIKNEWENVWFCKLKDLQADPKVSGTKITFSTPVRLIHFHTAHSVCNSISIFEYGKYTQVKISKPFSVKDGCRI